VCDKKKYARIIERLITFLEGDGEKVRRDLEADMKKFSYELKFEEAQKVKETLFALEHIRDAHLISRDINEEDRNVRIEGFDIAHLSGKERVGVMTVVLGGVVAKHEYKKFKISSDKNDDLEGLKELFERRIKHLDWGVPEVVVVDGDERHVRVVEEVLRENFAKQNFPLIQVVAATKNKSHKVSALVGEKEIIEKYKKEIILVNAEAHRFALSYHKVLRSKKFLN
jgi:excinuclease ABC subunit C